MSKRAIMQSTQVCVSLSLNVVATDEHGTRLATFPILYLSSWFLALWGFGIWLDRIGYELAGLVLDFQQTFDITLKLWSIGLSAIAFGIGVRL